MANLNVAIIETAPIGVKNTNDIVLTAQFIGSTEPTFLDYFALAVLNTIMPREKRAAHKNRPDWDYNKPQTHGFISWVSYPFGMTKTYEKHTISQIEGIINNMGLFEFLKTIGSHPAQRLLEAYKEYAEQGNTHRVSVGANLNNFKAGVLPDCCYKYEEQLGTWIETYIPHFHFTHIAPFQKHGETYRDGWVKKPKGVIRRYRELV